MATTYLNPTIGRITSRLHTSPVPSHLTPLPQWLHHPDHQPWRRLPGRDIFTGCFES